MDELDNLDVSGKIVLINNKFNDYSTDIDIRTLGPI